jgi:hypothetical protein
VEILTTPEVFDDPLHPELKPCGVGTLTWEKVHATWTGVSWQIESREHVTVGTECMPFESIGSIQWSTSAVSIGAPTFGRVHRLLVESGEEVAPGQPVAEFETRPPTHEEWEEEWHRAIDADKRCHDLERLLSRPWWALKASLTGNWKRRAKP